MKRLIAYVVVSTLLAIGATGCAHNQLNKASAKQIVTGAVVVGVVLLAATYNCANCNIGTEPTTQR